MKNVNKTHSPKYPACFGRLDTVFPKGADGLRNTPASCRDCIHKVTCLRSAMAGTEGLKVQEEKIDRAYAFGMITFFERWSKKKNFQRKIKEQYKGGNHEDD
ncbi:hypothetical protein ACFL0M_06465 [Thermodesulfobacteriota bacterium]